MIVIGIVGTIVPLIPGSPLIFLGVLLFSWYGHFQEVGLLTVGVIGALTLLSLAVDFVATALGAKKCGASGAAALGAMLGTIVGIFFALPGIIIGPFVGAVLGEMLSGRHLLTASKAGFGTWLGLLLGTVVKVALASIMVGLFAAAWIF